MASQCYHAGANREWVALTHLLVSAKARRFSAEESCKQRDAMKTGQMLWNRRRVTARDSAPGAS
jgi:hypothetical protein